MDKAIVTRLREFIENETRSCSMDYGCITPLYVYRMLGGHITLKEIEKGLALSEQRDEKHTKGYLAILFIHICPTEETKGIMTQDELWNKKFEEVLLFIKENRRNLSKYNLEERQLFTWLKHNRKQMNQGLLKPDREKRFKELLAITEHYKRKNQYE